MEENKPFMPPPPPKMPPFPPRNDGQQTGTPSMPASATQTPPVKQEPVLANEQKQTLADEKKVEETSLASAQQEQTKENKPAQKPKKERKKASLATMLYWVGFCLALVGLALCIYFLVK